MDTTSNIDKTINCICDWIQNGLSSGKCDTNREITEMTTALAELIQAKAVAENKIQNVSEYVAKYLAEELERAFKCL